MRRRQFLGALGGVATWPLVAQAQPKMSRVGVMLPYAEGAPEGPPRIAALRRGLERLGWVDGRNVHIDYRWTGGVGGMPAIAKELVALAPDLILAQSNPAVAALLQATRSVPIVFVSVAGPVDSRFVESLARPGGNTTGFSHFEPSIGGKWLEVLKEIAPSVKRAVVLLQMETAANVGMLRGVEAAAPTLGMAVIAANVRNADEIDRAVTAFAAEPNGGLIAIPHPVTSGNRNLIFKLTAQHQLPAVYPFAFFAKEGGLVSYGVDQVDQYRRAASYVDRILKGEKAGELPVQVADKFELTINLRTAKALGLEVPPTLTARADEVIE